MPANIDFICGNCTGPAPLGSRYKVRVGSVREGTIELEWWCSGCARSAPRCGECETRYSDESAEENLIIIDRDNGSKATYCYFEDCYVGKTWICEADNCVNFVSDAYCYECKRDIEGNLQRCRCGSGDNNNPIHSSSCQPTLVFHGDESDKLMIGFELEMEFENGAMDAARYARVALQVPEIAQLKHDGSLNNGFEIVTQPHTFKAYRDDTALWSTIQTLRDDYGGRSWDPKSCGFHIHLARAGFSGGRHMHRFIEFVYRHPEEMMKFGGRKSTYARFDDMWGMDEYDRPIFTFEDKGGDALRGGDKYTAVNTNKEATLELRFMRGTTKIESIFAYLGMAHAIAGFTRDTLDIETDDWRDWSRFVDWVTDHAEIYPELLAKLPNITAVSLETLNSLTIDA